MSVNFSFGSVLALFVAILAFLFLVFGAPDHVIDWIFGLILALAIARMIP